MSILWHLDASTWYDARSKSSPSPDATVSAAWRPTSIGVTVQGLAMLVTTTSAPPTTTTTTTVKTAPAAAKAADALVRRTIAWRDVVSIVKDVSWWVLNDAVTLTLANGQKEYISGLAAQQEAFDVITHFWNGWWATVNELRHADAQSLKGGGGVARRTQLAPQERLGLQRIDDAMLAGIEATNELNRQTEQLEHIYEDTNEIEGTLQRTQKLLNSIASWWYVPTASSMPKSVQSSSKAPYSAQATPSAPVGELPGKSMLVSELRGHYKVVRMIPPAPAHVQACILTFDSSGLCIYNEGQQPSSGLLIRLDDIADVKLDQPRHWISIRETSGRETDLLSSRMRVLIEYLEHYLPNAETAPAGVVTQRRSAPKQWGASSSSSASSSQTPVRPVAVVWKLVDEGGDANGGGGAAGRDVGRHQLQQQVVVPSSEAYLREVSSKMEDLALLATALGSTLDYNLELLDKVDTAVDNASHALKKQTKQTTKIINSL